VNIKPKVNFASDEYKYIHVLKYCTIPDTAPFLVKKKLRKSIKKFSLSLNWSLLDTISIFQMHCTGRKVSQP